MATQKEFIQELYKQIEKYEKDHSHMAIITCDINDVYRWIKKAKKKANKKIQ